MRIILLAFGMLLAIVARANSAEMTFKLVSNGGNCNGCEWIAAEGKITENTPARFVEFVREYGATGNLVFNSGGGNLNAALKLGELIRVRKLTTSVNATVKDGFGWYEEAPGKCVSACAYAFLGGETRLISGNAQLGFHQFYDKRAIENFEAKQFTGLDRSVDQYVTGLIVQYLSKMGVSISVYTFAAKVPPNRIAYVSRREAIKMKIDNSTDLPTPWRLTAYRKGLVAEFEYEQTNRLIRLYCRRKTLFIAVSFPNFYYRPNEGVITSVRAILNRIPSFKFKAGKRKFTARLHEIVESKKTQKWWVVFKISRSAAKSIIEASSFEPDVWVDDRVSRVDYPIFDIFVLRDISGDKRLAYAALRNCI